MAAACFAGGELETTGQEAFVWMTNTNSIRWKETGEDLTNGSIDVSSARHLVKIVDPENVVLSHIYIDSCVNLTNLVIHTDPEKQKENCI